MKKMSIQEPTTNDQPISSQQPTDELYEHYRFEVTAGTEMLRIDKYLFNLIANTSRNKVQQAAKADCILVNGKPVRQNYKVRPGDTISVLMPNPPNDTEILPEHIPLNIVYEDKDLLIVNKEPGMVVHPAYGNYTGTLVNALYDYFQGQTLEDGSPVKPLLVHRIDKNTSGLLVVTKNELAQMRLAKTFFDHNLERKYWALVWGSFDEDAGTIVGNVGRNPKDRMVMTVFPEGSPPDPRPHAAYRAPALQRRGLRRQPHPQRHHLHQIPAVHPQLFRPDAPSGTSRQVAGLQAPHHRQGNPLRVGTARGLRRRGGEMARIFQKRDAVET